MDQASTTLPIWRRWLEAFFPLGVVIVFLIYLVSSLRAPTQGGQFDINTFSRLPILHGGRVKPLDTVARTSLLVVSGKQSFIDPSGARKSAISWLADLSFIGAQADQYKVFEIDDPDVLGLIGIQQ